MHNNKKGPAAMPSLLRRDAYNDVTRLEDETEQTRTHSATATERFESPLPLHVLLHAFLAPPRRFERVTLPFRPQLFSQSALPTSGHRMNPRSGAILILPIQNWSSFHCWMKCGRIQSLAQRWTCLLEH